MTVTRPALLFGGLFAVQMLCAHAILWAGLPVYRKLLDGHRDPATPSELSTGLIAVLLMQGAYWINRRLQPRLTFPRCPTGGHALRCLGELSFLFPTTFAALAVFNETIHLGTEWWRLLILIAILFAMFCYKEQLQTVGQSLMEPKAPGSHGDKAVRDTAA